MPAIPNLDPFWTQLEPNYSVTTLEDVFRFERDVAGRLSGNWDDFVFLWRGHSDSRWGLHTTLYRYLARVGKLPTSASSLPQTLRDEEKSVLAVLARSGLSAPSGVELPALSQLAMLRHYGGPARLLDVTHNPFVALFFACYSLNFTSSATSHHTTPCEPPPPTAQRKQTSDSVTDGRLFLIAIPRENVIATLTADVHKYVQQKLTSSGDLFEALAKLTQQISSNDKVAVWVPSATMDPRIQAQHAGFIFAPVAWGVTFGAVSMTPPAGPPNKSSFTQDEHQQFTDLAIRPHKVIGGAGRPIKNGALFTIRVPGPKKAGLLKDLEGVLNINFNRLYPDYAGVAQLYS